jgi:hypothetical protein
MTFASSRNVSKLADFGDKAGAALGDEGPSDQPENQPRSRFFGERQNNRKSLNAADTDSKLNRESWTEARQRRNQNADDERLEGGERNSRFGRRDRDQDGERRNGFGDRQDNRWGQRDDQRHNGEKPGGWRERTRQKQEREWERGGRVDKEPEWMDDPAPKQDDDLSAMSMPKNQEEFEKWKQAQHARNKKSVEEPPPLPKEASALRNVAPLKLESIMDKPFGGFGDFSSPMGSTPESGSSTAKTGTIKSGKQSRFMPMFSKKDEPKDESPVPEPAPAPVSHTPPKDSAEDKEGFQRILQMLGSANLGQSTPAPSAPAPNLPPQGFQPMEPASPPPKLVSNGGKPRSRFTGFFDQAAKSPERLQSPPSDREGLFKPMSGGMMQSGRGIAPEAGNVFGGQFHDNRPVEQLPRSHVISTNIMPDPMLPTNGGRDQQRPLSGPLSDFIRDQPPSRGAATPDLNIQNLLASQRNHRPGAQDNKNSEFLLNLMKGSSRPSSTQARPDSSFPIFLDNPPNVPETHAPKPHAPRPPGMFEEQLMRGHQAEMPRQEPQPPMPNNNEFLQRRQSQRAHQNYFDDQNYIVQQQQAQQAQQQHRRNFTEPPHQPLPQPGRRMSGHPNLQMQIPQQQAPPFLQQDFIQSPLGHQQQAPPPGFNAHMPRHPPGIHNEPRIFMPPQQQPQIPRDLPPYGHPGGGMGSGMVSPPNPPPGFYNQPPPGFVQMRSPTEASNPGGMYLGGMGQRG